jgi:hypothetical protein
MRSIDVLAVDTAGVLRDFFPPGDLVFPVSPADVVALDAAVRAALGSFRVIPPGVGDWGGIDALTGYIRERLPAFEHALLSGTTTVTAAEMAIFAEALQAEVQPVGGGKIPMVVRTSLRRAVARLEAFPMVDMLADHTRRNALTVAAPGWRPVIDPGVWIPDPVEVAAVVDPSYSPVVDADISGLVLFAVLCTVGPAASPVDDGQFPWRVLGDSGPDGIEGRPGAVVVRLAIHDDVVERLEYAVTPDGAHLRVALADPLE